MIYIGNNEIMFERADNFFIKKFGFKDAADMVMNYIATRKTPFIYDTHQLASFLCMDRKSLFNTIKNANQSYKLVTIKKKNGADRTIHSPNSFLKSCQKRILNKILVHIPVSKYATAYKSGAKLADNAYPHTNKKYMLKMDITDFFGSIRFDQVYDTAFNSRYYPKQIGAMLTTLCCLNEVLPQGAPTSPAISNIVMKNFDENIGNWCKKRDISYTRYCDDITFSSDKPLYYVFVKAKTMLEDMGFEINKKKTHFITHAARQSVTGLTVNDKVAVSKEYKRQLRQEVYYALKYGLAESIMNSDKTDFVKNNTPDTKRYYNNLIGRINFVLQIEPDNTWFSRSLCKMKTGKMLSQI